MQHQLRVGTCSALPLTCMRLLILLLVACFGSCVAKHWCPWTAAPCSVTCGSDGVILRTRVCTCKRNRSNIISKIKDKFEELIHRDCHNMPAQLDRVICPELPDCDQGRPSSNQIIAACIVTIVLLCVLFASAKTWVPALYKYYFVNNERRRRQRRQTRLQQQQEQQQQQPTLREQSVHRNSSSDNLSASFESSSHEPPSGTSQYQQLPLQPPPPPAYHDAVYGEVSGEPPPSYSEAVKEQRLQQHQQAVSNSSHSEAAHVRVQSTLLPGSSSESQSPI